MMNELEFLGTGAADWNIEERCGFFRRNSSALLNGEILFDAPEHIWDFYRTCGRADLFSRVRLLLVTHDHPDHITAASVRALAKLHPLTVACDAAMWRALSDIEGLTYLPLSLNEPTEYAGYRITPVLANHDTVLTADTRAVHYIVTTPDGKTVFYGLDGAWLLRPTWQVMLTHRFDLMIFDCTCGDGEDWRLFEHNTISMLRTMIRAVHDRGILKEGGRLVASHLARTLHADPDTTRDILAAFGMQMATDGMTIPF